MFRLLTTGAPRPEHNPIRAFTRQLSLSTYRRGPSPRDSHNPIILQILHRRKDPSINLPTRAWGARVQLDPGLHLPLLCGHDLPPYPFCYLRHYGVSEASKSVHPMGNPISHSTNSAVILKHPSPLW